MSSALASDTSNEHDDQDNQENRAKTAADIGAPIVETATAKEQKQHNQNQNYVQRHLLSLKNQHAVAPGARKAWQETIQGDR